MFNDERGTALVITDKEVELKRENQQLRVNVAELEEALGNVRHQLEVTQKEAAEWKASAEEWEALDVEKTAEIVRLGARVKELEQAEAKLVERAGMIGEQAGIAGKHAIERDEARQVAKDGGLLIYSIQKLLSGILQNPRLGNLTQREINAVLHQIDEVLAGNEGLRSVIPGQAAYYLEGRVLRNDELVPQYGKDELGRKVPLDPDEGGPALMSDGERRALLQSEAAAEERRQWNEYRRSHGMLPDGINKEPVEAPAEPLASEMSYAGGLRIAVLDVGVDAASMQMAVDNWMQSNPTATLVSLETQTMHDLYQGRAPEVLNVWQQVRILYQI